MHALCAELDGQDACETLSQESYILGQIQRE